MTYPRAKHTKRESADTKKYRQNLQHIAQYSPCARVPGSQTQEDPDNRPAAYSPDLAVAIREHDVEGQPTPRSQDKDLQHIAQSPIKRNRFNTLDVLPRSMPSSCLTFHWLRLKEEEREEQRRRAEEEKEQKGNTKKNKTDNKQDPPQACTCVTHQKHARHTIATKTAKPHRHMRNITAPATTSKRKSKKKRTRPMHLQIQSRQPQHLSRSASQAREHSMDNSSEKDAFLHTGVPIKKPPHPTT